MSEHGKRIDIKLLQNHTIKTYLHPDSLLNLLLIVEAVVRVLVGARIKVLNDIISL